MKNPVSSPATAANRSLPLFVQYTKTANTTPDTVKNNISRKNSATASPPAVFLRPPFTVHDIFCCAHAFSLRVTALVRLTSEDIFDLSSEQDISHLPQSAPNRHHKKRNASKNRLSPTPVSTDSHVIRANAQGSRCISRDSFRTVRGGDAVRHRYNIFRSIGRLPKRLHAVYPVCRP